MEHKSLSALLLLISLSTACEWAGRRTKEVLNKGGELAGSAATEVVEGVTTGVERTWKVDVQLSGTLQERGLVLGKTMVSSDHEGRNNNLVVYLSTERTFRDTLSAIAYDKDGSEMGRARLFLDMPAHTGEYHELAFQRLADLERKSRVIIR